MTTCDYGVDWNETMWELIKRIIREIESTIDQRKIEKWVKGVSKKVDDYYLMVDRINNLNEQIASLSVQDSDVLDTQIDICSRKCHLIDERNREIGNLYLRIDAIARIARDSKNIPSSQQTSQIKAFRDSLLNLKVRLGAEEEFRDNEFDSYKKSFEILSEWKKAAQLLKEADALCKQIQSPDVTEEERVALFGLLEINKRTCYEVFSGVESLAQGSGILPPDFIQMEKNYYESSFEAAQFFAQSYDQNLIQLTTLSEQKDEIQYVSKSLLYASKLLADKRLSELNNFVQGWIGSFWGEISPFAVIGMGQIVLRSSDSKMVDCYEFYKKITAWVDQRPDLRFEDAPSSIQAEVIDSEGNISPLESCVTEKPMTIQAHLELLRGQLLCSFNQDVSLDDARCLANCEKIAASYDGSLPNLHYKYGQALYHHSIFAWGAAQEVLLGLPAETIAFFTEMRIKDQYELFSGGFDVISFFLRRSGYVDSDNGFSHIANFVLSAGHFPLVKSWWMPYCIDGCTTELLQNTEWAGLSHLDYFYFGKVLLDHGVSPLYQLVAPTSHKYLSEKYWYFKPSVESTVGTSAVAWDLCNVAPKLWEEGSRLKMTQIAISSPVYLTSYFIRMSFIYSRFSQNSLSPTLRAVGDTTSTITSLTIPVNFLLRNIHHLGRGVKKIAAEVFNRSITLPAPPQLKLAVTVAQITFDVFITIREVATNFSAYKTKHILKDAERECIVGRSFQAKRLLEETLNISSIDKDAVDAYDTVLNFIRQTTHRENNTYAKRKLLAEDEKLTKALELLGQNNSYSELYQELQFTRASTFLRVGDLQKFADILMEPKLDANQKERLASYLFQIVLGLVQADAYKEADTTLKEVGNILQLAPKKYDKFLEPYTKYIAEREALGELTGPLTADAIKAFIEAINDFSKKLGEDQSLAFLQSQLDVEKTCLLFETDQFALANTLCTKKDLRPLIVGKLLRQADQLYYAKDTQKSYSYLDRVQAQLDLGEFKELIRAYREYLEIKENCPDLKVATANQTSVTVVALNIALEQVELLMSNSYLKNALLWDKILLEVQRDNYDAVAVSLEDAPDWPHDRLALYFIGEMQTLLNRSKFSKAFAYLERAKSLPLRHASLLEEYRNYIELKQQQRNSDLDRESNALEIFKKIGQVIAALPPTDESLNIEIALEFDALRYALIARQYADAAEILVSRNNPLMDGLAAIYFSERVQQLSIGMDYSEAYNYLLGFLNKINTPNEFLDDLQQIIKFIAENPILDSTKLEQEALNIIDRISNFNKKLFQISYVGNIDPLKGVLNYRLTKLAIYKGNSEDVLKYSEQACRYLAPNETGARIALQKIMQNLKSRGAA